MEKQNINKIDSILNSLDKVERAAAPDFFFTRLKARMENELLPARGVFAKLRPAYAMVAWMLILFINAVVIFSQKQSVDAASNENETMQSIASEYRINNNNLTYEINQLP